MLAFITRILYRHIAASCQGLSHLPDLISLIKDDAYGEEQDQGHDDDYCHHPKPVWLTGQLVFEAIMYLALTTKLTVPHLRRSIDPRDSHPNRLHFHDKRVPCLVVADSRPIVNRAGDRCIDADLK